MNYVHLSVLLAVFSTSFTPTGEKVRVVTLEGEPWFVREDIRCVLGWSYENVKLQTREALDREESRVLTKREGVIPPLFQGNAPRIRLISESGLYKLILRAHRSNPAARRFQDWVTKEVLPAIRKDGGYVMVCLGELPNDN